MTRKQKKELKAFYESPAFERDTFWAKQIAADSKFKDSFTYKYWERIKILALAYIEIH
jgi:hypothetical protein